MDKPGKRVKAGFNHLLGRWGAKKGSAKAKGEEYPRGWAVSDKQF